jgi:hypothetical protein
VSAGPSTILEVDHVIPVSEGGPNHEANLVTACFDCNRGKSKGLLESVIEVTNYVSKYTALEEQKEQIDAYLKFKDEQDALLNQLSYQATYHLRSAIESTNKALPTAWKKTVCHFLKTIPLERLTNISESVGLKVRANLINDPWKYFCGACHTVARDIERSGNGKNQL